MNVAVKGDTRQRLVAGALTCIRDKGLAATTSRDIASAAGANLAAITYHFGSKDALVAHALLDAVHRWLGPARSALATGGDPAVRAAAVVSALESALSEAQDWVPAYLEAVVAARHRPPLAEGLHALRRELHGALAGQIDELRGEGVLGRWVVPEEMAGLLMAMADGIAVQVVLAPSADHRPVATQALALLLAAAPHGDEGT
jgi:AcrR family transcriptional regulator